MVRTLVRSGLLLTTLLLALTGTPAFQISSNNINNGKKSATLSTSGIWQKYGTSSNQQTSAQFLFDNGSSRLSTELKNGMWTPSEDLEGPDKVKACVPYLLPLLDGDHFGKFIYERVPIPLGILHEYLFQPLVEIFNSVPFLGLIFFLVLALGTRGNTDINKNVRFSAQQAILIDVALVFPELIGAALEGEDIPRYLAEPCSNFVWYVYMSAVVYSLYSNLQGKKPSQIPFISGYADLLVGPF